MTSPPTTDQVIKALDGVQDPEIRRPITDLGMVKDIEIGADGAVTSRVMTSRSGQPATVSHTCTRTNPSAPTSMSLTMPSSVMGRRISGSWTPSSALVTCSVVGGEVMSSCYEPIRPQPNFP